MNVSGILIWNVYSQVVMHVDMDLQSLACDPLKQV